MKFFGMLLLAGSLQAATIHVPTDQPTIQAGINIAATGDTVLIADGTYTGDGNYNVDLLGKAITVKSANGPAVCILDAQGAGRLFTATSGEDTTTVIAGLTLRHGTAALAGGAIYCLQSALTLRDCTIEACEAVFGGGIWVKHGTFHMQDCVIDSCRAVSSGAFPAGGALYVDSAVASVRRCQLRGNIASRISGCQAGAVGVSRTSAVTLDSCLLAGNAAVETQYSFSQWGGALACDSSSEVTVLRTRFHNNGVAGTFGGAIFCDGGDLLVRECEFTSNGHLPGPQPTARASTVAQLNFARYPNSGGAIYVNLATACIEKTVFASNGMISLASRWHGGAILVDRSITTISGCTFVRNFARNGHAIYCDSAQLTVDSSIIAFNESTQAAGLVIEVYADRPTTIAFHCSDLFGNQHGDWVGVLDTLADKYNNFSLDPQFCRKSIANYQLQEDSPCRPAASPCGSLVGALPVAPDCNSCCEGSTGNVNTSGIVDLADLSLLIAYLTVPAPDKPVLACVDEANVSATGIIDLADLSLLVAYLTVPAPDKPTLPWCP